MSKSRNAFFTSALMKWHWEENMRVMPWKGERDPYRIWLSEVILQQTRVEQGLAYYEKFIQEFPSITDLADAPEKKIFKLWEGLGYYSRCRSLIHTAKFVKDKYGGHFPNDFETISQLKGVGPYTAAAISSFAFDLPHAVLDGNVKRVIARVFGISTAIDTTAGIKFFSAFAQDLLDLSDPGAYNQAIMDLGATICKPKSPNCEICPFYDICEARLHDLVELLPLKEKKLKRKQRFISFIVAEYRGSFYVRERKGKDIWLNLHEFIPLETKAMLDPHLKKIKPILRKLLGIESFSVESISDVQIQELTHQRIAGRFIHVKLSQSLGKMEDFSLLAAADLHGIAFPKFILSYLRSSPIFSERKPNRTSKR